MKTKYHILTPSCDIEGIFKESRVHVSHKLERTRLVLLGVMRDYPALKSKVTDSVEDATLYMNDRENSYLTIFCQYYYR